MIGSPPPILLRPSASRPAHSQADRSPHRGISQIWFVPALLRSEVVMLARAVTIACVSALTLTASAGSSRERSVTECTKDHVCYCADQELKCEVQQQVRE